MSFTLKMFAPTSKIETITIVRPLKVIAFICGIIVIFLLTLAIVSTNWLTADKYRQGLWDYCIDEDAIRPLPFNLENGPGCYRGRDAVYIEFSGILCCLGLAFDFLATVMTGFGLVSKNARKKYTLYRFALYVMVAAFVVTLTALVVYPAYFAAEFNESNRLVWELGWSYGVGCGGVIFLLGAILLLLCDKETEEIFYKERTIMHANNTGNDLKA